MKKFLTFLLLFVSVLAFSQNNGINFQGVGRNSSGAVLATQKISLRFTVIQGSETGSVEYVESKEVTTNAQGIFSVVIGDGTQISKTGNFTDINWKINPKFLKVEMDPTGGASFAAMGITRLQSVPFAYYANGVNADNVDGVLSASKGGTGVASISALKTALGVDQINNTSDLAKPISTAMQEALDNKVSSTTFSTTVATKANLADLDLKANATDLAVKAPIESPTFTGTVSGITKAMVGLSNVENTADLAKPISSAIQAALDTKVSSTTFSTTVATKENFANKSTATDLGAGATSDILFPTQKAVKTYVDGLVNSGGVQDGGILNRHLADLAVTNAKVATGIDKSKVGLSNVDNTADIDKPVSTATQTALDNKLDVGTAEAAYARVDQSNLFHRDQAIEGGLTANRINLTGSNNSYMEGLPIPETQYNGLNIYNDLFVSIGKTTSEDTNGWKFDIWSNKLILPNGTEVRSGNASETVFQLKPDTDFTIKTSIDGYNRSLQFDKEGYLRFSDGGRINDSESRFEFKADDKFFEITIGNTDRDQSYSWKFDQYGSLKFPNGPEINVNEDAFAFKALKDGIIEITTQNSNDTFYDDEDDIYHYWSFDKNGKLTFPDGTIISGNITSTAYEYPVVGVGFEAIDDKPFIIQTKMNDGDRSQWMFDQYGSLQFPGTYTALGNTPDGFGFSLGDRNFSVYSGDENGGGLLTFNTNGTLNLSFRENDLDPSTVITNVSMGVISNTSFTIDYPGQISLSNEAGKLSFEENGSLAIPGTIILSNTTSETAINVSPNPEGWSYLQLPNNSTSTMANVRLHNDAGNIEFATGNFGDNVATISNNWILNKDGSLTFPDLTIASGNISNTGNFGFDTRATENGFSILTGTTSSSTQVWTFGTDGVLTLPQGGDIKDQNGNSVLSGMRFLSIEHIPNQNTINATNNIYNVDGVTLRWNYEQIQDVYNGYTITLDRLPISIDHVALYINGARVKKSKYSLTNNQIKYLGDVQQNQSNTNYLQLMLSNDDIITIDYFY